MGKRIGILVVLLLVLVVAADRGGQYVIERVVAGKLKDSLRTPSDPSVDIAGIPFLPQLFSREFDKVTLSARNADAGGVRVARIDAKLKDVKQAGGGARVGTVTGKGLITYDALTAAVQDMRFSYGGDGLVKVTRTISGIDASASARPSVVGDQLVIKTERVSSSLTGEAQVSLPPVSVKLRDIPPNLRIDLDPGERGVAFEFGGTNVLFVEKSQARSMGGPAPFGLPVLGTRDPRHVGSPA